MGRRFSAAPFWGRAPLGARVVVLNVVLVFRGICLEFLAQLFVLAWSFLDLFLDGFLTRFLLQKSGWDLLVVETYF